jgi:hypothetical protein
MAASIRSGAKSPNPSVQPGLEREPTPEPEPEPEPPKPPGIKVEADYILPSDSDDEAPSGGYYIVEGKQYAEPSETTLPPPQLSKSTSRSKSPIPVEPSLIRPKYTRPIKNVPEDMALSDSDDEPPPGGYQVKEGTWASTHTRDTLLGKSPGQQAGGVNGVGTGVSRRNSMPTKKVERFKVIRNAPLKGTKEAP